MPLDYQLEDEYRREFGVFCGVDEAGRGPLAGDVYAAAVILPEKAEFKWLDDSKKVTPKRRDILFDEIKSTAAAWSIASATVEEIERLNILEASQLAMRRAVAGLSATPEAALIDGNIARNMPVPAHCIVGGDAKVPSISAASILAKVARDRYCLTLDEMYPQYGFAKHKGYGTKAHIAAIREFGPSPVHRMSFLGNILRVRGDD